MKQALILVAAVLGGTTLVVGVFLATIIGFAGPDYLVEVVSRLAS